MLSLSWLVTVVALVLLPMFVIPARLVAAACSATPGSRCSSTPRWAAP